MNKSKKKLGIILAAVLIVLVAAFALTRVVFLPEASEGGKQIVFQVISRDGSAKDFDIQTDAETLGEALLEQKLIDAEDGPYGLYVTAVFGETADEAEQEYWMFTKGGEMLNTGVSDTYIADGEHYEAQIATY